MPPTAKDPTEPIRMEATRYPAVDEGTACNQSSFKAGKKAFLFCGPQGGRYKAMFKLEASRPQAEQLAAEQPDRFDVGKGPWVTARFSAEMPLPKRLWKKWLDESYALTVGPAAAKSATRGRRKATTGKSSKKARNRKASDSGGAR